MGIAARAEGFKYTDRVCAFCKIYVPTWNRTPIPWSSSPLPSHGIDCALAAPLVQSKVLNAQLAVNDGTTYTTCRHEAATSFKQVDYIWLEGLRKTVGGFSKIICLRAQI